MASIVVGLDGEVWLKSIRYPLLNQRVRVSDYSDIDRPARASIFPVSGRSAPVAVLDVRGLRTWAVDLRTSDPTTDRKLDLSLLSSDVMLLHVPDTASTTNGNALLPGSMYVVAGDVRKHRLGGVSAEHLYSMTLTEVAPPAADIIGTTLTWGTVRSLFGSWEALRAANPSWRDLLATVGSPDDLVAL